MKQLLVLLALSLACVVHAALPGAERLLPADTLGYVTVPDWAVSRSNFNRSTYGRLLADPAMKAFADKLTTNLLADRAGVFEREVGVKLQDYAGLVRGQLTLAITRNGWDGSPDKKPGLALLIDTRDQAAQARTNLAELRQKWTDKGKKLRAEKIRDVEFITFVLPPPEPRPGEDNPKGKPAGPSELSIGMSDTLLVLTDAPKDAERILALQSGATVPALADQAAFASSAAMVRDAAFFLWLDARSIVAAMAKTPEEERPNRQAGVLGPAPSLGKIFSAIGIADVKTIAASTRDSADGSTIDVAINVPEAGRKGLLKILAVDQKDSSPPPFVPADAVKFSRWRIDLQKAWSTVENMLVEISPGSSGVIKLIIDSAGKDRDPNFDLRKQLLENLGDDLISYEKVPRAEGDPSSPPSLVLVGAKNAEQMASSLRALSSILPPNVARFKEREFLGRKIYSFTWPSPGAGRESVIAYAASGGYVAMSGDPVMVEEYLRSNEGKQKPLREMAGLNEAAQKVGGMNTGFFGYENQLESMRTSFETARKNPAKFAVLPGANAVPGLGSPMEGNALTNWFDPSLLPAFDRVAKYFFMDVAAVNVGPGAITFKIFTPIPPALRN
jgi:hypothetical protein